MTNPNETIPYVTRNLRHLLAAPNLTETQRTIITRTLATLSEEFPGRKADIPLRPVIIPEDKVTELDCFMRGVAIKRRRGKELR